MLVIAIAAAAGTGCGGKGASRSGGELTFETLHDTTGLSAGDAIVQAFDAYRMDNGAMRVHGRIRLPDGARVQVAVKAPGGRVALTMVQVSVFDGAFDSPPMIGAHGPLPKGRYVFEISAHFTPDWQPADVLRATDDGRSLRGPGITRTQLGGAMLWLVEDLTR